MDEAFNVYAERKSIKQSKHGQRRFSFNRYFRRGQSRSGKSAFYRPISNSLIEAVKNEKWTQMKVASAIRSMNI